MAQSNTIMHRLAKIEDEIENAFSELIHSRWTGTGAESWHPALDLYETHDVYLLTADLPGVKPSEVDIYIEGNRITIRGSRTSVAGSRSGRYIVIERRSGCFSRTITVDHEIDENRVEKSVSEGVFYAVLPKKEPGNAW